MDLLALTWEMEAFTLDAESVKDPDMVAAQKLRECAATYRKCAADLATRLGNRS